MLCVGMEKVNSYIESELEKRELSPVFKDLQAEVYLKIVYAKAALHSLREALKALEFANTVVGFESLVDVEDFKKQVIQLDKTLENNRKELQSKFQPLIGAEHKEDLIKLVKKTKFKRGVVFDHKTFESLNDQRFGLVQVAVCEELLKLAPYEVSKIIEPERHIPEVAQFVDLYRPQMVDSDIDFWIKKYQKNDDEVGAQVVREHYIEIMEEQCLFPQLLVDIVLRWATTIGMAGTLDDDETKEAVQAALAFLKLN